jgi:hypothetical protein
VPTTLDTELAGLGDQITKLRSENARLLRLLELTPSEACPPGPVQTGIFDAAPGAVHAGSPPAAKVAFYAAMFAARSDAYAMRWENVRTSRSGWMPAVPGGSRGRSISSGAGQITEVLVAGVLGSDRGNEDEPDDVGIY